MTGALPGVWVDLASPSHPFFFASIVDGLDGHPVTTTVRDKTETVSLTEEVGLDYTVVGKDFDTAALRPLGLPLRTVKLATQAPDCAVSLSARNGMCTVASKVHGIRSIHFTDNDITTHRDTPVTEDVFNWLRARSDHHVVPAAFETSELTDWGATPETIHTYDGYMEDVYVAEFTPDPTFVDQLPFDADEYLVVRPEAMTAAYVDIERSLVPALLERAREHDIGVVYLPRNRANDASFADPYDSEEVYVPDDPLDGLQLAWHARCVMTGSGTMAREAAAMRKPAVSFFPHTMLSVDQELVEAGRVFHSRDPGEIFDYVTGLDDDAVEPGLGSAMDVRDEVVDVVEGLIPDEGP